MTSRRRGRRPERGGRRFQRSFTTAGIHLSARRDNLSATVSPS
jgi:hypothetical protein